MPVSPGRERLPRVRLSRQFRAHLFAFSITALYQRSGIARQILVDARRGLWFACSTETARRLCALAIETGFPEPSNLVVSRG